MIADKVNEMALVNEASRPGTKTLLFSNALINLDNNPVKNEVDLPKFNNHTRELLGALFIKYMPYLRQGEQMYYPFIVGCSMFSFGQRVRVGGYADVVKKIENPQNNDEYVLKWLFENTDLGDPDIFELAKQNYGIRMDLGFSALNYARKINSDYLKTPTYIYEVYKDANAEYQEDRMKGKNRRIVENERIRNAKAKEAKKCRQQ